MRIVRLNVMIPDCPRCGYPIMLDGFTSEITCESCHNMIVIHRDQWRYLFYSVYEETGKACNSSNSHLRIQIPGTFEMCADASGVLTVSCQQCSTPIDVQHLESGATALLCHQCGREHPLISLPKPTQAHSAIFALDSRVREKESGHEQIARITMYCPNCNAPLKISRQNDRITACEFCNVEFLIPDSMWKRFHPMKTATPWFLLFDQPPPLSPEELAEMNRKADNLLKEQAKKERIEKERNSLKNKIDYLNEKIGSEQLSFNSDTGLGYAIMAFLGVFLGGFPILFIPSLARIVGGWFCNGVFDVSISRGGDSGNYHYYCTIDDISNTFNVFIVFAILIGIGIFCCVWTVYLPVRYFRHRATIRDLEEQRNKLEEIIVHCNEKLTKITS